MHTSRRARLVGVVVISLLTLACPHVGSAASASAMTPSSPLSSCPASAQWAIDDDPFDPMRLVPVPATITMVDGTSQPVGVVTPPAPDAALTGSSHLSWSPDGTALAYWQLTSGPNYVETYQPVVADWDGSDPVPLPGMEVAWSPSSDRVLVTRPLDGTFNTSQVGHRTPSGWDFVTGPRVDVPSHAAWSSDGALLAWVDLSGAVWVGDADGQQARLVGQAASEESPLQFKPGTHLVRIAGPTWFDVDANVAAGAAPTGLLSPSGEWSAWSSITDPNGPASELFVSHNGGSPVTVAAGASGGFPLVSLSWSPDSRYLVSDDGEELPNALRRAPLLFDSATATATILGPWLTFNIPVFAGPSPTIFRWAPGSTSFFAQESSWSAAGSIPPGEQVFRYDVDGTRTLINDWGVMVGAVFWPRTTAVTRLDLSAHLDPIGADGTTQLHVIVTNDGPCDAADVVVSITTPAGSPGVSINAVQTLAFGTIPRGQRAERVVTVVPEQDLPLTLAVSTSTADEGRSAGPLTLTSADVPPPPPPPPPSTTSTTSTTSATSTTSTTPTPSTVAPAAPPVTAATRVAAATPVAASPAFTG